MTLRGGGKGGPPAGRRTSSAPSISETHKKALDRLVASETKEKKRAERRKLVKLVKRVLKKGGVKLESSSFVVRNMRQNFLAHRGTEAALQIYIPTTF